MSSLLQAVDAATSLALAPLAQDPVPSADQVRPGYIALGLMVLMCVATVLLWMNMRKQIRKIDFDETDETEETEESEESTSGNGS